jgi:succinate-semialdehyde dehydrogenase/glutarate-semialdehyde dehydrogenase
MSIVTVNPFNNEPLETYPLMNASEIDLLLEQTTQTQARWRRSSFTERAQLLMRLAKAFETEQELLAQLMTREMGKPISQARQEIIKCAQCCRYYAEEGPRLLADRSVVSEARKSYVSFQSLGVILAVMPWNFPFWQVIRALVPNIMVGNGLILKHAANTTGCALAIEQLMRTAQAPDGLMRTVLADHQTVAHLIGDARIRGVTLTGSTPAGRDIAAQAGRFLKKSVLELGGSDAYVIFADVPVVETARACVEARLINSGQSCIAAKRFVVMAEIYDEFMAAFQSHMQAQVMGDPSRAQTTIGPLARRDLRDELHQQVMTAQTQGARVRLGGRLPELESGAFYAPTILTDVSAENPVYNQELFGPVAQIFKVTSEEQALQLANDSPFGLGAAIWTQDLAKGEKIARDVLNAGCCFVNEAVKSDMRLPFGGVKNSGYGRELGEYGLTEFSHIKTVYIH